MDGRTARSPARGPGNRYWLFCLQSPSILHCPSRGADLCRRLIVLRGNRHHSSARAGEAGSGADCAVARPFFSPRPRMFCRSCLVGLSCLFHHSGQSGPEGRDMARGSPSMGQWLAASSCGPGERMAVASPRPDFRSLSSILDARHRLPAPAPS
jgi:hypothetical protein